MRSRMRPLALVGIVSALGAGAAHAQSNDSVQPQVTQAVTVFAQREPVITVLAPRETPSAVKTARPQQSAARIGKAVDADGDGLADASAAAAREGATGRPSGKRTDPTAAAQAQDCGDKAARTAQKSACAKSNPQYKDKTAQGQNPLHEP